MSGKLLSTFAFFFVFLGIASPELAYSRNWARVDLNNVEYMERDYIDLGSFVVEESVITFMRKVVNPDASYSVQKVSIDCRREKYRVREYVLYGKDGAKLDEDPSPTPWLDVRYTGPFAHLEALVCYEGAPKPFDRLTAIGALIYNLRQLRGYELE